MRSSMSLVHGFHISNGFHVNTHLTIPVLVLVVAEATHWHEVSCKLAIPFQVCFFDIITMSIRTTNSIRTLREVNDSDRGK